MRTKPQKKILVIDDDPGVLSVLKQYLERMAPNLEVTTAADGMEGLAKLRKQTFDLVITDMVMPYVSGLGLLSALKAREPRVPVIVITGHGKESEAAALEKHADSVLPKPLDFNILGERINRLLAIG